jgi:starch phosphorylase
VDLSRWQAALEAAWSGIRFGALEARATNGGWTFRIPVALGGIDTDAVRVELYADPNGESLAVREPMKECAERDAAGTRVFECAIATSRPASDFTPRVVAFHPEARLPLELPLLTWQR